MALIYSDVKHIVVSHQCPRVFNRSLTRGLPESRQYSQATVCTTDTLLISPVDNGQSTNPEYYHPSDKADNILY